MKIFFELYGSEACPHDLANVVYANTTITEGKYLGVSLEYYKPKFVLKICASTAKSELTVIHLICEDIF